MKMQRTTHTLMGLKPTRTLETVRSQITDLLSDLSTDDALQGACELVGFAIAMSIAREDQNHVVDSVAKGIKEHLAAFHEYATKHRGEAEEALDLGDMDIKGEA